ncbi:MAG: hypothetical protein AB1544_05680 [Pseudomonadota bacterium]|jgi:predicted Ser/Thr protein kinase
MNKPNPTNPEEVIEVEMKIRIDRVGLEIFDFYAEEAGVSRAELVSRSINLFLRQQTLIIDFDELMEGIEYELSKAVRQAERLPCLHSARRRSHLRRNQK